MESRFISLPHRPPIPVEEMAGSVQAQTSYRVVRHTNHEVYVEVDTIIAGCRRVFNARLCASKESLYDQANWLSAAKQLGIPH